MEIPHPLINLFSDHKNKTFDNLANLKIIKQPRKKASALSKVFLIVESDMAKVIMLKHFIIIDFEPLYIHPDPSEIK